MNQNKGFGLVVGLLILLGIIMPWRNIYTIGSNSIGVLMGAFLAFAWFLSKFVTKEVRFPRPTIFIVLLFYCWILFSTLWTPNPALAWGRYLTFTIAVVLIILVWDVLRRESHLRWFFFSLVFGGVVVSNIYLYYYLTEPQFTRTFLEFHFNLHPGGMARRLIYLFPLAWYLSNNALFRPVRLISSFYVIIIPFVIFLTGTRQALVILITFTGIILLNRLWNRSSFSHAIGTNNQSFAGLIVILIITILFAFYTAPTWAVERTLAIFNTLSQGDVGNRRPIWRRAIKIWLSDARHILMGSGISGFTIITDGGIPHSSYFGTLVNFGVIGFILYLSIILSTAREIDYSDIVTRETSVMMLSSIVILSLVSDVIYDPEAWLLLGLILVLAYSTKPNYDDIVG